ncbi:MAG: polysaccharide biosynthesis tyrosine autokinase [Bacteriovoracia bacterium]
MSNRRQDHSGRTIGTAKSSASSLAQNPVEKVLQLVSRHLRLYLVVIFFCAGTSTVLHFLSPSYRTKATLMLQAAINNPLQSLSARLGGFSGFDVDGREVDRYLNQLRIHAFYERAARDVQADPELSVLPFGDFGPSKRVSFFSQSHAETDLGRVVKDIPVDRLAESLQSMIAFSKDGIDAFSIHVQSSSAEIVSRLTNLLARSAVNALIEFEVQDLQDSEVYLRIQANKSQEAIRKTEQAIADFKRGKSLLTMSQNFDEATIRSVELKRALAENQLQIDQNKNEIDRIGEAGPASSAEPFDYKFGVRRKLASLRKFDESLRARNASLQRQLRSLQTNFDEHAEQQLMELKKNLELETSLHQELKKHDFQMEMRRISARSKFHLLEPSRPEVVQPSESLPSKLLVSFVVAMILSSFVAFAVETVNPLAASKIDIEEAGLSLLGSLPYGHVKGGFWRFFSRRESQLRRPISLAMAQKINSSAMQISARIMEIRDRTGAGRGQVVAVTSSEPSEGKTFTSERIARALASCENRVLLVDADLRAPALSQNQNALGKEGLCEVVGHRENFGNARIAKVAEGLDFLPAGLRRSNPTAILASRDFSQLLDDFRALYDFIVIDSAPIGVSGDSSLIAKAAEIPIVIVALNETRLRVLHDSVEGLWTAHGRELYAVLNKVPPSQHYGYGGYGRHGYPALVKISPESREAVRTV